MDNIVTLAILAPVILLIAMVILVPIVLVFLVRRGEAKKIANLKYKRSHREDALSGKRKKKELL